jgi:putative transposase
MTNIRRYDATGRPVFITAVCHRRIPYLQMDWQKELLLSVMREAMSSFDFSMKAYVIMGDHFHWIIAPGEQNFSSIMQSIKLRFVYRYKRAIHQTEKITVWQRRFWDHVIRDVDDLHRHMDYIHFNPVKHGCVGKSLDYKWSSFNTHVEKGHYDAKWGTGAVLQTIEAMDFE